MGEKVLEYFKNLFNLINLFVRDVSYDYSHWNSGICKTSGKPWIKTMMIGSDGSTLYVDAVGNYMWLKYSSIIYL